MSKQFRDYQLYFDGSCQVNPGGPGGWGFYIVDTETRNRIAEGYGMLPESEHLTNNVAEWTALVEGIKWLAFQRTHPVDKLEVFGDSDMVIKQARGEWKCKKDHLREFHRDLLILVDGMEYGTIAFEWIPREENSQADLLSRKALDRVIYKNR